MEGSKQFEALRIAKQIFVWLHTTFFLLGIFLTYIFVRVQLYGELLTVNPIVFHAHEADPLPSRLARR